MAIAIDAASVVAPGLRPSLKMFPSHAYTGDIQTPSSQRPSLCREGCCVVPGLGWARSVGFDVEIRNLDEAQTHVALQNGKRKDDTDAVLSFPLLHT